MSTHNLGDVCVAPTEMSVGSEIPQQQPADVTRVTTQTQYGAQGTINQQAPINQQPQQYSAAPTAFEREFQYAQQSFTLSEGAKRLVDTLMSQFEEINKNRQGADRAELMRMPSGGYLAKAGNFGIIFQFEDAMMNFTSAFLPKASVLKSVAREVQQRQNQVCVMDSYLITPDMYQSIEVIIECIEKVLSLGLGSSTNISQFQGKQFRIVNNTAEAVRFIKKYTPGMVEPYMQYGIVFEMRCPQNMQQPQTYDPESQWVPLFAVGGYTEFMKSGNSIQVSLGTTLCSIPQFNAVVSISACACAINAIRFTPLILAVAYDAFIVKRMCYEPFRTTSVKNAQNLGKLLSEENGKPIELNNRGEFETVLSSIPFPPAFAVDVPEGSFNYLGFQGLIDPKAWPVVKAESEKFLSTPNCNITVPQFTMPVSNIRSYIGTVLDNGKEVDSRSIDYFRAVNTLQTINDITGHFQTWSPDPEDRLKTIYAIGFKAVSSRYQMTKVIIDLNAVHYLVSLISQAMSIQSSVAADNLQNMFTPELRQQATQLNSMTPGFGAYTAPNYQFGSGVNWSGAVNTSFTPFIR